jgi:hypothetical protein
MLPNYRRTEQSTPMSDLEEYRARVAARKAADEKKHQEAADVLKWHVLRVAATYDPSAGKYGNYGKGYLARGEHEEPGMAATLKALRQEGLIEAIGATGDGSVRLRLCYPDEFPYPDSS